MTSVGPQNLAAGPALPAVGVTATVTPVSVTPLAKAAALTPTGAADLRMVGASAEEPLLQAADGREQQQSDPSKPADSLPNGTTETPDILRPPDGSVGPLENFLTSMGKIDDLKFFSEPVREQDAPGYFAVIKSPMDLQTMLQKVCLM